MNETEDGASLAQAWLARLLAPGGPVAEYLPQHGPATVPALAALAAEALARQRTLLLVTESDAGLADISNALDLNLRPLCLVLPAADHVSAIALRATLSLLKSRLTRTNTATEGPAWADQRRRLADYDTLWWKCLAWSKRGLDNETPPEGMEALFPVRILPLELARRLSEPSDWVVVTEAARHGLANEGAWPGAQRTLLLGGLPEADLHPPVTADPDARRRAELEVLTQELSELELELATAQAEIAEFTQRYHMLIGARMALLDELRAEIALRAAQAEAADEEVRMAADGARARADRTREEHRRFEDTVQSAARPFRPSGDLKKLFRKLAQKIHPDRARSESDRAWRTQLMAEANRAYQAGDEAALLEVQTLWQEGASRRGAHEERPDPLDGQIERLRRRISDIESELNRLFGSRLYELYTAAGIARRTGRDLLQEMAERLDADIAGARAQLA